MKHRGLEASSNSGAMVNPTPQITVPLEKGEIRHHQSHQGVEKQCDEVHGT